MQVHKAIELLQGLTKEGKLFKGLSEMLIGKLMESEKFEFDFEEFPNGCKSVEEFDEVMKNIKLPYELCYFEVPNFGSILAFHPHLKNRHIKLQIFYYNTKKQWSFLDPCDQLCIDLETGLIQSYSEDPKVRDLYSENSKENELTTHIINLVVRGLSVLNCSNIVTKNNLPDDKLNKKRIKNGKVPLFSYKTLHIKTDESKTSKPDQGGTHASPRLHLRRGHIRHLPKGNIWITDCVVGDVKKGIVLKDYKVT